ncbi:MAG: hypothetical protein CMF49_06480 [Legionellales bacterium]|nr:hypothetical protein [Legionellales bacterium]|tara:strand:- start:38 stop:523 length:486 start_codon:yes stop_codon:yes gene_type:complete
MKSVNQALISYIAIILIALFTLNACNKESPKQHATRVGVNNAFQAWIKAVNTAKGNTDSLLPLYQETAIVMPMFTQNILKTAIDRKAYFQKFTAYKNLTVSPKSLIIQTYGDIAVTSGLLNFYYLNAHDKSTSIDAQFSFVYKKTNGKWLIINQHVSVMSN